MQSALAPKSNIHVVPLALGNSLDMAGLSIPGNILKTKRAVAIRAPVLPALTQASTTPSFTKLILTRIDESFLFFNAL